MEWIEPYLKAVLAGLTGIAGWVGLRWVFKFINEWRRTSQHGQHVSTTSNLSTLQVSDQMAKEWLQTASDAKDALWSTKDELLGVKDELRKATAENELLQARVDKAERAVIKCGRLIVDVLLQMHAAGLDTSELEKRAADIHGTT